MWKLYLKDTVGPLVRDERILVWDLCNEPKVRDRKRDAREYGWLKAVADFVRSLGTQQPITIGTMYGDYITSLAPLVDVLCGHPYARTRQAMVGAVRSLSAIRQREGKPLLVNECIPGCLDDLKRAEAARYSTELLSEAGFGWMGWSLKEGLAVATRRDRIDGNGIDGQGFHAWFTKDGRMRAGLEFLSKPPRQPPPWKRT